MFKIDPDAPITRRNGNNAQPAHRVMPAHPESHYVAYPYLVAAYLYRFHGSILSDSSVEVNTKVRMW